MRLGELARKLGVSAHWLRRLEKAGRVPPPPRDINGHRRYGPEDIAAVKRALFTPGTRVADTVEGRARVNAEIERLREWCRRQGIRWTPPE
jgi:predicted site-specific integrase-resolvase